MRGMNAPVPGPPNLSPPPAPGDGPSRRHPAGRVFLLVLVIAISFLFLKMVRSFLMALLFAGIFAALAQPLYKRLIKVCRGRRGAAAVAVLVIVVLVVLVPLLGLLGLIAAEAVQVGDTAVPWVQDKINHPDQVMLWLQSLPFYDRIAPYQDDIMSRAGQAVGFVSRLLINGLSAATSGTLNFLFMLVIMLYAMYFFLEQGSALLDRILFYLPLEDHEERLLLDKFSSVSRATMKGVAVIGLVQGTLGGLAFWAAGLPSALFWGALMVVTSVIPGIGTALVWVPGAIVLLAKGHVLAAILLTAFFLGVVGSIDNVLRPRLVGKDTQLPELLILLSTLGGVTMFGMLGLVIGPVLAALFVTVWEIYGRVFADVLPPRRR